jgi:hypothetical protein
MRLICAFPSLLEQTIRFYGAQMCVAFFALAESDGVREFLPALKLRPAKIRTPDWRTA